MLKRRNIRERGKLQLSKYFQEFKEGERVAVVRNLSFPAAFHKRLQGCSGNVIGRRGRACVVEIKIGTQMKKYIIPIVHLKKLKA